MARAISLWQPWALAWLLPGVKEFETRHWYCGHRGPLLIHAAKKKDGEVRDFMNSAALREIRKIHHLELEDFHFGALIGRVDLIGCSKVEDLPAPSEMEDRWGNWAPGRFAWKRGPNPVIFAHPIQYRGMQGIFSVPDEVVKEL
jgi:hypothetical protein